MNRAFLIIAIPAVIIVTAYILLAIYAGVQLTYLRAAWRPSRIRAGDLSGEFVFAEA